jgi:excisionase family DNA binding protein
VAQRKTSTRIEAPSYLRTAEVADILHVSPKTVSRWAKEGKLPFLKTLGGHRRYPEAKIRELANDLREEPTGEGNRPRGGHSAHVVHGTVLASWAPWAVPLSSSRRNGPGPRTRYWSSRNRPASSITVP